MTRLRSITVVGASLAGLRAVEALRRRGYDGRLDWIGAEPYKPYDRPPLSKQLLLGAWQSDKLFFRKKDGYEGLDVHFHLGARATALSPREKRIALDDGSTLAYDGAVIATGAAPRTLPGSAGLEGVLTLRTLDDALALRALLEESPRVVVVGGGFIGLEVAAVCRQRGLPVTVIEALDMPLSRQIGALMGRAVTELHRGHGVEFRLGRTVVALEGGRRVETVVLDDGARLDADVVVVGIGVRPETEWLEGSGLVLKDGVVCDRSLFAGVPNVVAAGDVVRWDNALFGESMRVEHWTNAVEQANASVERLLAGPGHSEAFCPVPYFWSDQYDVKIQFAGRARSDDEVIVVDGSVEDRKFLALFGREGKLRGVLGFNRPAQVIRYRRMIAERMSFTEATSQ